LASRDEEPRLMALDPQLQVLVDALGQRAGQAGARSIDGARRAMAMARLADGPPEPVATVRDITIPTQAGAIGARCYLATDAPVPAPLLVWFHGGGFVMGDLDSADPVCRRLANRCEAMIVSVDYRLAPEHPAPAAVGDAWDAVTWIASHADELGCDGDRIAVGGDSAGGNLAALVALRARDAGWPTLHHQLLVYPATDLTRSRASHRENAGGIFEPAAVEWFYDLYLAGHDPADPRLSPDAASDLRALPPAVVVTAGYDPLRDEGIAYAARLADAGVVVEHQHYPGMLHGFFQMAAVTPTAIEAAHAACKHLHAALRAAS
jgi:acetyl esterase